MLGEEVAHLDADRDVCERLAREIQRRDGYPPYVPDDSLRRFVATPAALGAWVATVDGEVVGHVALHRRSSPAVMRPAAETLGIAETELGVVARLFVSPTLRRDGMGSRLLQHAAGVARALGLTPVLDVATELHAAVALYERSGWVRLGEVSLEFAAAPLIREYVYTRR